MSTYTVLLAEDHAVVRQGVRALLELSGDFQVLGEAATGLEAVALAEKLHPDVVVMDIAMPGLNGCEATRRILSHNPAARILVLSAHSDDEYVARMAAVGALGFVEKESPGSVMLRAVATVARGEAFFSPAIARRMLRRRRTALENGTVADKRPVLTTREEEVLQLVASGAANKQIAAHLEISIKTVEKHRQRLMDKLDIHETAGLTRYAIASGAVDRDTRVTVF